MKILLYGFGEINRLIAKYSIKRGHEILGVVDISPNLINKDIGEVLNLEEKYGVYVKKELKEAIKKEKPDVVLHATSSFLDKVLPQINECIENKLNVISTCEELSYPYIKYPKVAEMIDKKCKEKDVKILACGVNPGFIMDSLPIFLTLTFEEIKKIEIKRIINSSTRRASFRKKIGIGLTKEEFFEELKNKTITGHIGLTESIGLLTKALSIKYDQIIEENIKPIIARTDRKINDVEIKKGKVIGIKMHAYALYKGEKIIELNFIASETSKSYDLIKINGNINLLNYIRGGLKGDEATSSILLNIIKPFINSQPGLKTILDFNLLHYNI